MDMYEYRHFPVVAVKPSRRLPMTTVIGGEAAAVDGERRFQPVKSAERAIDVLERLAGIGHPPTLAELARDLGIPKSSLHGILRTLERRGWVETDASGQRFVVGIRALQVGARYLEVDDGLGRASAVLDWLAETSGETVQLARLNGADVVYLAKRESRHPLQLITSIGSRLPAHATALGKAILAERDPDEVRRLLPDPLPQLTRNTIGDHDQLARELSRIRQRGFAVDDEEATEGLRCLAVPVHTGPVVQDAVSFSVPAFRLTRDAERRLVELLTAGRQRIEAAASPRSFR